METLWTDDKQLKTNMLHLKITPSNKNVGCIIKSGILC